MNRVSFLGLNMRDKARVLSEQSELVSTRVDKDYQVFLHSFDGMYIEVFYLEEENRIDRIKLLDDTLMLYKYFGNSDMKERLN